MADYKLSYTGQEIDKKLGATPNWDQNDPTAIDYIKNRPFYSVTDNIKKVVLQSTPIVNNNVQWNKIPFAKKLVAGETYDVTFKLQKTGENTELIATVPVVAKLASELNSLPQNLEDFVILQCRQQVVDFEGTSAKVTFIFWNNVDYSDTQAVAAEGISSYSLMCGAGTISAEIDDVEETVHKLSSKYLDTVSEITDKTVENAIPSVKAIREYSKGGSPNWEQHNPDEPGYIENKPFYEKIDTVTHIIRPQEIKFQPMPSIAENFYVVDLELDSRENDYLNKIVYPEYGDDYILEIDGIEYPISIIEDDEQLYFGNLSIVGMGSDTGENFFGSLYIDEDEEYIDGEYIDYYTLYFNLGIFDQNDVHIVGLKFKENSMPLFNSRDRVEYDWGSTNSSGEHVYYREYYPYGMYTLNLLPEDIDLDNIDSIGAALPIYQQYYASNFYFDDQVYENIEYKVYRRSEWDSYLYFGNMHLKYSDAPNTGESFLYLPYFHGGYIYVITSDPNDHNIRCEFINLPETSVIKTLDKKFLPKFNFVLGGAVDDKNSLAIGEKAKAESESLAINGHAINESLAIGHGSYAGSQGLHINYGYNGVSGSSNSYTRDGNYITFTYGGFNVEPPGAAISVDYPIKIESRYLQNNPENLDYVIIKGTWYKEKEENGTKYFKIYSSEFSDYNIVDSGQFYALTDNLSLGGVLIGSGFSGQNSISVKGYAYGSGNVSLETESYHRIYGDNNISIKGSETSEGNHNIFIGNSGEVSGNNNINLGKWSNIQGDNNIVINSKSLNVSDNLFVANADSFEFLSNTYHILHGFGDIPSNENETYNYSCSEESVKQLKVGNYYYITGSSYSPEHILEYSPDCDNIYKLTGIGNLDTTTSQAPVTFVHYLTGKSLYIQQTCYVFEVGINAGQNSIVVGPGNYSNTDNQIVLGSYAKVNSDTAFMIGVGENNNNRKNLLEVNKNGIATIEGLEIRNTNNEASYTSQDCMVLRDVDTGWEYAYQMKSGALVTILLPTHIEVTKLPDKLEYEQGDILDPSGMEVTAFYPDGQTQIVENIEILPVNNREFLYNIGINAVPIKAKLPLSYITTVNVNVVKFDYESALIDFNYTVNTDGSITLDSWKQTLNGQSSTEMIIPNNGLIIF